MTWKEYFAAGQRRARGLSRHQRGELTRQLAAEWRAKKYRVNPEKKTNWTKYALIGAGVLVGYEMLKNSNQLANLQTPK